MKIKIISNKRRIKLNSKIQFLIFKKEKIQIQIFLINLKLKVHFHLNKQLKVVNKNYLSKL